MCRVLRLSKNKRERQRELSDEDKLEKRTRVSPFVFDSHDTTKENNTDDEEEETLKEETTLSRKDVKTPLSSPEFLYFVVFFFFC